MFLELSVLTSTVIERNTMQCLISKGFTVVIDFLVHNAGYIPYPPALLCPDMVFQNFPSCCNICSFIQLTTFPNRWTSFQSVQLHSNSVHFIQSQTFHSPTKQVLLRSSAYLFFLPDNKFQKHMQSTPNILPPPNHPYFRYPMKNFTLGDRFCRTCLLFL